jgi:UPF0755 protein
LPETPVQDDTRRTVPGPRRRRTPLKRVVMSLLAIMLVGIAGAGAAAWWGLKAVQAPGPLSEPTNVVIQFGQRTPEIADLLEQSGVVSDQRLFLLTTYLTRSSGGDLKAGEYEFPARASLAQVLSILRSGRAVVHRVTVPEGWTSTQVVERVNAHPALVGTISEIPPEGSLLPDTYVFQRGLEREVLIARMRDAQTRLLEELWAERDPDLPIESKEEAVILASIVEKETGVAEERPQVAAVFINRLRKRMRLQSDPTIIYGIVGGEGRLDRPIRRSDISESTPYNTYRIDGLPPTPIANPGREAIAAVLQPDATDYLYFVADGTGGHAFARTLDEHNRNVRRWRQIEQAARDASREQEDASPTLAAVEATESTEAESNEVAEATDAEAPLGTAESGALEPTGDQQTGDQQTGDQQTGDQQTGDQQTGDQQTGDQQTGDQRTGDRQTGPVATVDEGAVPIPKPKPSRN